MTTVLHTLRNETLEQALTAQVANRRQVELTYNPGGPVDSIIEHALAAAKDATGEQREHLKAIIELAQAALSENHAELRCEREIAAAASRNGRWTTKSFVAAVRAHLDVLGNPIMPAARKQEAHDAVAAVVDDVHASGRDDLLVASNANVRKDLRMAKFTALQEIVARRLGAAA